MKLLGNGQFYSAGDGDSSAAKLLILFCAQDGKKMLFPAFPNFHDLVASACHYFARAVKYQKNLQYAGRPWSDPIRARISRDYSRSSQLSRKRNNISQNATKGLKLFSSTSTFGSPNNNNMLQYIARPSISAISWFGTIMTHPTCTSSARCISTFGRWGSNNEG